MAVIANSRGKSSWAAVSELARALQRGQRIIVRSQSRARPHLDAGFSLVEAVVAAALLATSLAMLAELFAISVRNNANAKNSTVAAALASQKIEQLRGDATLSVSAPNTLRISTDGYVEYLDPNGTVLGNSGTAVPDGAAYVRRWSIEPVPGRTVFVLQVRVTRRRDGGAADQGTVARVPEEARMITIARRAP